jgi:hypothetical protein
MLDVVVLSCSRTEVETDLLVLLTKMELDIYIYIPSK